MPPVSLLKDLTKCKHPNSRKTKALAKKAKRFNNREKTKLGHAIKSNMLGEKFNWFMENIGQERTTPLSPSEFDELVTLYLHRFDEEVEQINIKQSISKHRINQHSSRLSAIKITIEKETAEYNGGGFEFLNLCEADKFKLFSDWDGNTVNLQHIKLERISKKLILSIKE